MALEPPRTGGSRTMVVAPMGRCKHRGPRSDRGYGRGSRPFGLGPYDAGSGGAKGTGSVSEPGNDEARTIDALLSEDRVFEPPAGFRERAVVRDPGVYEEA